MRVGMASIRGSQKRKERVSLPEDAFRPGAAIETMQAVVGVVTGCELIGGRLGGLREVEPDRFCSAVNRTEDWNGFIDGTGILHFQFQFIKNIHENLLRIASTTKIARAARDDKSEVRVMSEEQKKKVEGVLHEMKHMNAQQIEVMIAYMQGVAAAAKLMGERKEQ